MISFAVLMGPATWGKTLPGYGYSWDTGNDGDPGDDVSCWGESDVGGWIWAHSWGVHPSRDCSHSWGARPGQSTRETSR